MLLCSSPVYEGISGLTKHSNSDRLLHVAIDFVIIMLQIYIRTNGSTPILILCFQFLVTLAFVIRHSHYA